MWLYTLKLPGFGSNKNVLYEESAKMARLEVRLVFIYIVVVVFSLVFWFQFSIFKEYRKQVIHPRICQLFNANVHYFEGHVKFFRDDSICRKHIKFLIVLYCLQFFVLTHILNLKQINVYQERGSSSWHFSMLLLATVCEIVLMLMLSTSLSTISASLTCCSQFMPDFNLLSS